MVDFVFGFIVGLVLFCWVRLMFVFACECTWIWVLCVVLLSYCWVVG